MKDTVISLAIAFILAFVFRGFVIEPFIIPTGSMAPTLVGAHVLARSPETGATWAIGPWLYSDPVHNVPALTQGKITVPDPVSGERLLFENPPIRPGDRIFVLKYLYAIFEPSRFDVVVFKNPEEPNVNFIKRLIGLPHEQVALVDGDIFTRDTRTLDPSIEIEGAGAWSGPGWKIQRKPERVQRTLWQPVFDSAHTPLKATREERRWFKSPWIGSTQPASEGGSAGAWAIDDRAAYRFNGAGRADLTWNEAVRPIADYYPYGQTASTYPAPRFPVSDIRVRAGIEPDTDTLSCWITLTARAHCFQAEIGPDRTALRMAPVNESGTVIGEWTTLSETSTPFTLPQGSVTNLELWHTDQALQLWADGEQILHATYDWSPAERFQNATGRDPAVLFASAQREPASDPTIYRRPRLSWQFHGSPFTLHNVALDRDIHYQATPTLSALPARATDPRRMPALKHDQYFVCGDNSPQSEDGRLWEDPNPWIALLDPDGGVVNRRLLIGKAFFVYWPATHAGKVPIFDAGRVRFIW
jgi:signal peptidase I